MLTQVIDQRQAGRSVEGERLPPVGYLQDRRFDPAALTEESEWEEKTTAVLHRALDRLDERSRDIIRRRWFDDDRATLHDLARHYGVSAERIRQLENNATAKLKRALS